MEALEASELGLRVALMMEQLGVGGTARALWRRISRAFPGMTIPSSLRFLKRLSSVTVRWREVTTLTPRPSVKPSTSVAMMAMVVSPSTASSAPMVQYSSSSTSSVTGGST